MSVPALDPKRWIVLYQEKNSINIEMKAYTSDMMADAAVRSLQERGHVVHAVRTQSDLVRALSLPLGGGRGD